LTRGAKAIVSARRLISVDLFVNTLDTALNVSFTALNLAYTLGYSKIVLAGFDYAFTDGCNHFTDDKPMLKWINGELNVLTEELRILSLKEEQLVQFNGHITVNELKLAMMYFLTECWFLVQSGVEIVNCTEGGIIDVPFIKNEPLSKHITKTPNKKESESMFSKRRRKGL